MGGWVGRWRKRRWFDELLCAVGHGWVGGWEEEEEGEEGGGWEEEEEDVP